MLIKRYANPYLASQGSQPCKSGLENLGFSRKVRRTASPNKVKKNNIGQKTIKVSKVDSNSDSYVRKYNPTKYVPRRTDQKNTYRCVLKLIFSSRCTKDVCDSIWLTEKYICQLNNFFIQKIDLKPCLLNMTLKQQENNTYFASPAPDEVRRSLAKMIPFKKKKSFTKMCSSKGNNLEERRKKRGSFFSNSHFYRSTIFNAIQLNDQRPGSRSVCPFVFLDVHFNTCRIEKQTTLPKKNFVFFTAFSGNFVTGSKNFQDIETNAFADILLSYDAVQRSGSYNCHTWHSFISCDDERRVPQRYYTRTRFKKAKLFSALNNYYNFYWRSSLFKQHVIKAVQQHTFFSTIRKAPASSRIFTVTRSPFIFKKTREQFALTKNFYYSTIKTTSNMHLQLLLNYLGLIKLPVEFKIMITHI